MATLDKMPSQDVIGILAGIIDFYEWKGIPCARRWPRKPKMPRSPAVQQSAYWFGYFATQFSDTPTNIIDRATELSEGTAWTWRDLRYRALFGNLIA